MSEQSDLLETRGLRVLREPNLWPYLAGQLASACGTWFQNIAQALLVWRLTHSTFLVGVVNFSQFAGSLALAPWAGAAADHYDRRKLMIVTQVMSIVLSGILAALAAAHDATAGVVILLAAALGLVSAFTTPAMLSMVPQLVPDHEISGAIALNAATFNLARAVGPVIGAVVVARLGIPWAFGLNSLSYLALIAALLVIHPRPQPPRPPQRPKLRESIALVRNDTLLLSLLVAIMVVAIASDPVTTLTPAYATKIFHHHDTWAGVLIGAYGAGAVMAALRAGRMRDPERTLAWGLAVVTAGLLVFAFSTNLAIGMAGMLVSGFGYLTSSTMTSATMQLSVEDSQRGRIMAIWTVAFVGVRPFASLADGGIGSAISLPVAAATCAVPALVMAAVFAFRLRRDRDARSRRRAPAHRDEPSRR